MRYAVLAIVALVAGVSAIPGQDEAPWAEKLFDNKTEHNFGSVAHGTQMLHKFPFKNIYAVPLEVTIARVSCGCTTATTSTQKVEVNGTGSIDVLMNGRVFTGARTVRIYVTFSSPATSSSQQFYSTAELRVVANSRPDIVFNPGEVNFGVVAQGQGAAQAINVEYAGALPGRSRKSSPTASPWTLAWRRCASRRGRSATR